MRRLLAAAVLVAFMPTVHAQDKGKSDFSHNAEFRLRDVYEQNESGKKDIQPAHHNGIEQRFKLGLKFKANEKFSTTATLLQSATWGQASGDTTVGDHGTVNDGHDGNVMTVNEAFATWMMSEDLHANFGRMNYGFGDGSVMSVNDWQMQPNSFDGVTVNYEMEFGRFTAFAFKYRDYTPNDSGNPATNLPATTSDPQHDAYGLVFDLKTMPEFLKAVNMHVIQDVGDAVWDAPSGTSPSNSTVHTTQNHQSLRYGAMGSFAFGPMDLKANYEMVTGKNSDATSGGAVADASKRDISANMYQAELGFNMPAMMASRFYVSYHRDSGRSKSDQTAGTLKDTQYDGYFYDRHNGSGLMELIGWGNLTDLSVGATLKPMDSTEIGAAYHMLSKTSGDDTTNAGTYGRNLINGTAVTTDGKKKIGDELDVWAEHKYEGGLSMIARIGYFNPGDWLKDDTGNKRSDAITQFMVQGKLTF